MIGLCKTKSGKMFASGTGRINSDPRYKTIGSKNTPLTSFYITADTLGFGNNKEYESYLVQVWGEKAAYFSNFLKGEEIYLEGEVKEDEYASKKSGKNEYLINATIGFPSNVGEQLFQLNQVISLLNQTGEIGAQPTSNAQNGEPPFDYSALVPDDVFPEPDI